MAPPLQRLPDHYSAVYVGRIVKRDGVNGVVKYAEVTRLGRQQDADRVARLGVAISSAYLVEWADGSCEVIEDSDLAAIATPQFAQKEWVLEKILALQAVSLPSRCQHCPIPRRPVLCWPALNTLRHSLPTRAVWLGRGQGRCRN